MKKAGARIVERERVHSGWNTLDIVTVEAADPDGTLRRHKREIVDHGNAAAVLPIDRQRGIAILVRQWRTGLLGTDADPYLLEACAGLCDAGETPEETVRREAEEEIGFRLRDVRAIGSILPSVGTTTERIHLFVAEVTESDRLHDGGGIAHEGESIEVVEMPLAELFAMARRGDLDDAKTLAIVLRLMLEAVEGGRQ
jgi:nudix-type nucleoside diphosphatase (YffH/AdpP family)